MTKKLTDYLDHAVLFTLLSRSWSMFNGIVTTALVVTCFSGGVQGYYYTFGSLLMTQTFLELGFGYVLVQFVSHEWAHLALGEDGSIQGQPIARARLASLVNLSFRWYAVLGVLFFICLGGFGQWFLPPSGKGIDVYKPWWLLCLGVSLSMLTVPLRCLLDGSNRVALSQRVALLAGMAAGLCGWAAILKGANLYVNAVIALVTAAVNLVMLVPLCRPYLRLFQWSSWERHLSWRREFWPQQKRIGMSWLAGYFMYQCFVPIAFRVNGAEAAGKLGATLQIYNAVNFIASSFLNAAGPRMGILGANREFALLRRLVRNTWLRGVTAALFLSLAAVGVLLGLHWLGLPQAHRFAEWPTTLLFLAVVVIQQLINVETAAIRFQKIDPFVANSILCAVLMFTCNVVIGRQFGLTGVACGFAAVILVGAIPWCHHLYLKEMKTLEGALHES